MQRRLQFKALDQLRFPRKTGLFSFGFHGTLVVMKQHNAKSRTAVSAIQVIAAVAVVAMTGAELLAEPAAAVHFWPNDIQQGLVALLGGTTKVTFDGLINTSLSWLSVFLRLSAAAAAAILCTHGLSMVLRNSPGKSLTDRIVTSAHFSKPVLITGTIWLITWYVAPLIGIQSLLNQSGPLILALLLASLVSSFLASPLSNEPSADDKPSGTSVRFALAALLLLACCWQTVSFQLNQQLYTGVQVPHGDSAMYEEHLWNVWHGKGFRSYLDQGLFLGEHIQVIHLLLLPLHLLLPSYLMMEWVSTACLAVCVLPIFRITLRHSRSTVAAFFLGLAWLFSFPMHFLDIAIDLKTLRPSCYGLPFLFFGIDFAEQRRLKAASVCLFTALLTQEDFALITGSLGFAFLALEWQRPAADRCKAVIRWSFSLAVFSVIWVLAAVLVIIPAFREGEVVHYSRYFGDLGSSPGDLIRTSLTAPMRVLEIVVSQRTLMYLLLLTTPVGLLAWKRPLRLSAGLVTFIMLSLIQLDNSPGNGEQAASALPPVPFHHFHAPLLPVIFWAAAAALSSQKKRQGKTVSPEPRSGHRRMPASPAFLAVTAFLCSVFSGIPYSLLPAGAVFWSETSAFGRKVLYNQAERGQEVERILERIPQTARVASTDCVHTRLTHYERSYDYSGYLRAVNNYQDGVPPDTDYIIIDTTHRYSSIRSRDDVKELREQPQEWELISEMSNSGFLVLKRRSTDTPLNDDAAE